MGAAIDGTDSFVAILRPYQPVRKFSMSEGQRPFRLLVTGGGTGGHTYPALTVVRTLKERLSAEGRGLDVLWVGVEDGLEARVAEAENIPFEAVATGKIRRARNPLMLASPANLADMGRVAQDHQPATRGLS